MLVSYFIGKKVGKPFLRKHGKWIKMTPARLEKLEKWFNKYGPWTIIIAYFIPGVRHFASYISGMNGMGNESILSLQEQGHSAGVWYLRLLAISSVC